MTTHAHQRDLAVTLPATLAGLASEHIDAYTNAGHARKEKYHRLAKRQLRRLAKLLNLSSADYDLRTNKSGIAVCGETTLHTDTLYIQVSQSCFGKGHEILLRKCNGRKDYSGGMNNFAGIELLDNAPAFLNEVRRLGLI